MAHAGLISSTSLQEIQDRLRGLERDAGQRGDFGLCGGLDAVTLPLISFISKPAW
jgi:hypothetical protein